jgi:GT2 family glycosyltransferase
MAENLANAMPPAAPRASLTADPARIRRRHGCCSVTQERNPETGLRQFGTAAAMMTAMNAHARLDPERLPDAATANVDVVVCIPTFRRPLLLRQTLNSLAAQTTAHRFAVVIVENDAAGCEGFAVANEFLNSGALNGLCIVESEEGNVSAINAAFGTAREKFPHAEYFLMIDDDEAASPQWLDRMLHAAEISGADIVGGPVLAQFPEGAPPSLARHPAFRRALGQSGRVAQIYGSGNCLIRRRAFERLADPTFDPRFNFTGGGDTDFFTRARRVGAQFYWAADAVITETIPLARMQTSWLMQRGLCIGLINYRTQRKGAATLVDRTLLLAKNVAIIPLSFVRAAGFAVRGDFVAALHPVMVMLGRWMATIGIEPRQYGPARHMTPRS